MLRRLAAWIPAALWCALIFAASSVPGPDLPPLPAVNFDKVIHAGVYAVLGALCWWAIRRSTGLGGRAAVALGALLATLYGVSDEIHQLSTPGRSADVLDAVADAVGAIAGAAGLSWWAARAIERRRVRKLPPA